MAPSRVTRAGAERPGPSHAGRLELEVGVAVAPGTASRSPARRGRARRSVLGVAAGLLRPAHGGGANGETWLDTERAVDLPPDRRRCGYVFQDYALFPHLSAWQNVAYGLRGRPRASAARGRSSCSIGSVWATAPRTAPDAQRRGAPAGRGGACARSAAGRAPARRAALGARRAHTRRRRTRARRGAARDRGARSARHARFSEAAQLGDRVGIVDSGRVVQQGTPSELAAAPRSAFVADFTGAVVLTGTARRARTDSRGSTSTAAARSSARTRGGPVALSVYPWEIAIEPAGLEGHGSARFSGSRCSP